MKKYRYEFSRGVDTINDKALLEGAVTVCDNVDLRSGNPRPIPVPTFESAANSDAKSIFRYRGRLYQSSEYRSYATDRIAGRDVVYFSRDGKYPAKMVEGIEVPLGTRAPGAAPKVSQTRSNMVSVSVAEGTVGLFKKDQIRSYRIAVETKGGILPACNRAVVKFTADNKAANLSWSISNDAVNYLIFAGDEGAERLIFKISASHNTYVDTGATSVAGALASTYDVQNPYTYFYTFKRNVKGVENESGPSPLSVQALNGFNRQIEFDRLNDGFFDQANKTIITSGITITPTSTYSPALQIVSWVYDPNGLQVKFTTQLAHHLKNGDKVLFNGFLDANWQGIEAEVSISSSDTGVFYVKNRPVPTDPSPTQFYSEMPMIAQGGYNWAFDDGHGAAATSIIGNPAISIVGGWEAGIYLSPTSHTNYFPWSEPQIANLTVTGGVTNTSVNGLNAVQLPYGSVQTATATFSPTIGQQITISALVEFNGNDYTGVCDFQFVIGGDVYPVQRSTGRGNQQYLFATTVTKTSNTSNQTGFTRGTTTAGTAYRVTAIRVDAGAFFETSRYIKTTGVAKSQVDYTMSGAIVTLTDQLRTGSTGLLAENYSVFVPGHTAQKQVSLFTISPTPSAIPSTDDAVYAIINGTGSIYRAKNISADSFELNVVTSAGATCSKIMFVKDNGYITHRRLYRTGDTSGWNLVDEIPIWTSTYNDTKSYNYLGDPPDSFYAENGVKVVYGIPSSGMSGITSHAGMLFGIEDNKVRWTPVDRPDAWPENFYLSFEGKPIALASYGQSLAVLCDDALYRIEGVVATALSRVGTRAQNGCIAPNSVQRTNAGLIYLSKRGVMVFDGQDATCITDTRIPGIAFYAPGNADIASNNFYPTKYTQAYQALSGVRIGDDWDVARLMFSNVAPTGYIASLRSFYVDGKYYLYASASDVNRDANTMWCIDLEANGAPITTLGLKPLDVFVDADETTYMLLNNAGSPDVVSSNLQAAYASQLNFWQAFAPTASTGNAIYKFNTRNGQSNIPWFIRTGANSCSDPFERKKFRSIEIHTFSGATSAISFRIWIDGNYICDGQGVAVNAPSQPRKINIPQGRQLGYAIDVELAGTESIRGIEINYDPTSSPS